MKYIILLTLSFLCFSLNAQELGKKVVSFKLENGDKISVKNNVKLMTEYGDNRLNFVELNSGEIFYDTEIKEVETLDDQQERVISSGALQLDNGSLSYRIGDGSGGG